MGKTIAQCSDDGMPSISDPGHELVKACLAEGIAVIALPGPTAGLTALIASGLSPQPNLFYGFLPRKKKEQKQALSELATQKATMIFYESPYRIAATIETMLEVFGERQAVICRELTKIHEEYLRGTFSELIDYLEQQPIKGECCLLVEGSSEIHEIVYEGSYAEQVAALMEEAEMSSKEAIKEVAKRNQVKKQLVYQAYHQIEE